MERYAIYYVLPADDPLYLRASAWLGHSIHPDINLARQAEVPDTLAACRAHTRIASRYGFHATLKPPFRLREDESAAELRQAFREFAQLQSAFTCVPLAVSELGHFLALMPARPCGELSRLAIACVEAFERFRAPLTAEEMKRGNPGRLNDNQRLMLEQWGYPYVMDEYRFHMTLSDRLEGAAREKCRKLLENHLAPVLPDTLTIDRLSLCHQDDNLSSFTVLETELLGA